MNKIPISAVVITYNEERYLERCLKSIDFCEEIIVIDLGSTDKSKEIAVNCGAKLFEHDRVPIVEIIHSKIGEFVKNEWVLITDPDEVTDPSLATEIINNFNTRIKIDDKIAAVNVPWLFYFKRVRLIGTVWGGVKNRIFLVNTNKFEFTNAVHTGRKIKKGFDSFQIEFKVTNAVHHYWMSSYKQLKEKHIRYIKQEGKTRYDRGKRTSIITILKTPYCSFKQCFFNTKGYKDGFNGLFLSFFWMWYCFSSEVSLYRYQRKKNAQS